MSTEDGLRKQWLAMRLWYASRRLQELCREMNEVHEDLRDLVDFGPESAIDNLPGEIEQVRLIAVEIEEYAECVRP